jgi:hypothetical protein
MTADYLQKQITDPSADPLTDAKARRGHLQIPCRNRRPAAGAGFPARYEPVASRRRPGQSAGATKPGAPPR